MNTRTKTEWNAEELEEDFIVEAFGRGWCIVTRKSDDVRGTLLYDHYPRRYYSFRIHKGMT